MFRVNRLGLIEGLFRDEHTPLGRERSSLPAYKHLSVWMLTLSKRKPVNIDGGVNARIHKRILIDLPPNSLSDMIVVPIGQLKTRSRSSEIYE